MRILVLTNRFPRPAAPTTATYNLVQALAIAKHHEVKAIVPVPWPEVASDLVRGHRPIFEHTRFGGLEVHHPTVYFLPRFLLHLFGKEYLASIRRTVRRVVKELRPQAIFCCWAHPDGWAAVEIGRELGIPVLVKVIGSDVLVAVKDAKRRRFIVDALTRADGVVAVGEDLAKNVVALGVDASRVSVVPEGTDGTIFFPGDQAAARAKVGIPASEKTILFVGNVLVSKGAKDLILACDRLKRDGRAFHCRIVGSGKDRQALESLVGELGLRERVTFHGACLHRDLGDWYRACDLLALPSHSEGIPNVLREVELCGRPYVATRVGGVPEIARPDVSALVDVRDVPGLAAALAKMLDAPPVVDPAKARARHIGPEESGRMIVERLEALVARAH